MDRLKTYTLQKNFIRLSALLTFNKEVIILLEANHLKGLLCVGVVNMFSTEVIMVYMQLGVQHVHVLCFLSC